MAAPPVAQTAAAAEDPAARSLAEFFQLARSGKGPSSTPERQSALQQVSLYTFRKIAKACGVRRTDSQGIDALRRALGDYLCRLSQHMIEKAKQMKRPRISPEFVEDALHHYGRLLA